MKKIAVLSIPGLPNGWLSLESKLYHDYESILAVVQEVEALEDEEIHFESYVWPQEVRHPRYQWSMQIPSLAIPIYYNLYNHDAEFRAEIVSKACDYIATCLEASDRLYLILHSHGNRIAFDALKRMKSGGLIPEGKEIIVLSFAQAYKNVARGLLLSGLSLEDVKEVEGIVSFILNYRISTDVLSGKPPLEHYDVFKPKWYELGWVGHATVRNREDVMKKLQMDLELRLLTE